MVGHLQHELYGVRMGNYDNFNWKQALYGERSFKKFVKKSRFETSFVV
jgi:hypothetical protein